MKKKDDHINLSFKSQTLATSIDPRFDYCPHNGTYKEEKTYIEFLNKTFRFPLWISSMTGGGRDSQKINERLATSCREFGLGMSVGSIRSLLESKKHFKNYDLRKILGKERPYYSNIGLFQVESLLEKKEMNKFLDLLSLLDSDGLVVHINPIQEFLQIGGDRIQRPAIETLSELLSFVNLPIIVKEVGQGMSKESMRDLMTLPLAAIELAAFGGTNFSLIELKRQKDSSRKNALEGFSFVGHSLDEMLSSIIEILGTDNNEDQKSLSPIRCKNFIVSGGIKGPLDLYYYDEILQPYPLKVIYGMAFNLLKWASVSQKSLNTYVSSLIEGFSFAKNFLKVKTKNFGKRF